MRHSPQTTVNERELRLTRELTALNGPLMSGASLVQALGFKSAAALRQADVQGRLCVKLFTPSGRRGRFALSEDVARWLAGLREKTKE